MYILFLKLFLVNYFDSFLDFNFIWNKVTPKNYVPLYTKNLL